MVQSLELMSQNELYCMVIYEPTGKISTVEEHIRESHNYEAQVISTAVIEICFSMR